MLYLLTIVTGFSLEVLFLVDNRLGAVGQVSDLGHVEDGD